MLRPADVVEQQQRERAARTGAPKDDPQLGGDGVVVVVAINDERVGQDDALQRIVAGRPDELEVVAFVVER